MTALRWSTRLTWILEVLALCSLAGTQEVRMEIFVLVAAMFFLSRVLRKGPPEARVPMISERTVMNIMVGLVLLATASWFRYRFHPIVAASYAAPIMGALLWFAPDTGRYRGWRLGVGFVQLILASALAPEVYLFAAIFMFVLLGSIAVSCSFLDEELRKRAPEVRADPLPRGFISRSLLLAFMLFLTSVVIFPILPRMNMEGRGYGDSFKTGYTENVELGEKRGMNGREGTGEPILRLYSQDGSDLAMEIFLGLIRGRSLDYFDGKHWSVSPRRIQVTGTHYVSPHDFQQAIHVDAVRGSMSSTTLPVPYGAILVASGSAVDDNPFPRTLDGDWVDPTSSGQSARYSFAFFPFQKTVHRQSLEEDPPTPNDLRIPSEFPKERTERLAKTLFKDAKSVIEKVDRLTGYLVREKFSASLGDPIGGDFKNPAFERMHPLERFLFVTKEGHCELFASASAILLRMAGVPARLVAGFRISKGPVGGVLTLTTNDAHAWVEYWMPAKGWVALDPTPRLLRPPSYLNYFRDGYEWFSGYWYRYVLNFTDKRTRSESPSEPLVARSEDPSRLKAVRDEVEAFADEHRLQILVGLIGFLVLSALVYFFIRWRYPWVFSIKYRVREGDAPLRRERMRMERQVLLKLKQGSIEQAIALLEQSQRLELLGVLRSWQKLYERLRFGQSDGTASPKNLAELRKTFSRLGA